MKRIPGLVGAAILALALMGCPGQPRYSDDPEAARIQALTDFCIGYGALRDAATYMLEVDTARDTPILSADLVNGYAEARAFIKPFCAPDFDPASSPFDLKTLETELKKIRILMIQKEQA